jgi:hypothetical protein
MKPRRIFLTLCMAAGVTIVAAVLLVVGTPARAQGSSRYVSPTGTDSGLCSYTAHPCRTVQYAVDRAVAGDYQIGSASAALDAGVDAGVLSDIDRQPRPYLAPDLGADEYWPPGALNYSYLPLVVRGGP